MTDTTLPERVVVVGQGYVGLPVAMAAVDAGYDVTGLDLDQRRVNALNAGESFVEDVAHATVAAALAGGRYRAVTNIDAVDGLDIAIVSVPTPLKETLPDLSYIEAASAALATKLRPGATVILESTTYPGTTEEVVAPILEDGSGLKAGIDFFLGYSPERIDPGNTTWTLKTTPKVVSGVNPASLEKVQGFFDRLVDTTVAVSSPKEAELAKLLENTFRHVNIALVNELAMFAHELGIDVWEAIDAAATKPFGFMKFTPGPGVGGHCLPIDPSYLSWQVRRSLDSTFRFVELANDINAHMPDYVVRRITEMLNRDRKSVNGSTIAILGLAYKKNTGDARESPSRTICAQLVALGANVVVVDPHVAERDMPAGTTLATDVTNSVREADLAVLLVDHDAFDLGGLSAATTPILDCRSALPRAAGVESL